MTASAAFRNLAAVGVVLGVVACGAPGPSGLGSSDAGSGEPAGAVTVLAAASLTESFTELGQGFEAAHPGVRVDFSFASSATLASQIAQGAPADVFAAASPETMAAVSGSVGPAEDFATNTLQIAVPAGNPGRVSGPADFSDAERRFAICAAQVPCGAAAVAVFAAAGVEPRPDTLESDVKAVLQKVVTDEVDAGLVYRTDVLAAGAAVEGIAFPEAAAAVNRYPIATLREARNPSAAQAFVDYVRSAEGQQVLSRAGFGRP